jgi:hypothetical protein
VPGYPVYYAPGVDTNYFFYDCLYWVYQDDEWYTSSWYNGPWRLVPPDSVPLYILRVPVRYYRHAPAYFRGWRADAAPRWGEHWGRGWEEHHRGWDHWNRRSVPAAAPLPSYQRRYSGDRYPRGDQQRELQGRNYRYQPHENIGRQHFQQQRDQRQEQRDQRQDQRGQRQEQRGQQREQRQEQNTQQRAQRQEQRGVERQQREISRGPSEQHNEGQALPQRSHGREIPQNEQKFEDHGQGG